MCTGIKPSTASTPDEARINEAWSWAHWYIAWFGVPGVGRSAANHWTIQGQEFHGHTPASAVRGKQQGVTLSTGLPWYKVMVTSLPPIPPMLEQTLKNMSGTSAMGLTRLMDSAAVLNGLEGFNSNQVDFVRKAFNLAAAQTIDAQRNDPAPTIDPSRQIEGKVTKEFHRPEGNPYPYTVHCTAGRYAIELLPYEDAVRYRDEGTMPADVFAGIERWHQFQEGVAAKEAIPKKLHAVYINRYDPLPSMSVKPEPWPRMGIFQVGDEHGNVLHEYLQMAHDTEWPVEGQVFQFTAAERDLVFKDGWHTYFDLATGAFHPGCKPDFSDLLPIARTTESRALKVD